MGSSWLPTSLPWRWSDPSSGLVFIYLVFLGKSSCLNPQKLPLAQTCRVVAGTLCQYYYTAGYLLMALVGILPSKVFDQSPLPRLPTCSIGTGSFCKSCSPSPLSSSSPTGGSSQSLSGGRSPRCLFVLFFCGVFATMRFLGSVH